MPLYRLEILSELSNFSARYYNSLNESQKAAVATGLERPVMYRMESQGTFYRRTWAISGECYEAIAVVGSYSHVIRITPVGSTARIQGMDYLIRGSNNPWVGITSGDVPGPEYVRRSGYWYKDTVDTEVFFATGELPIYNSVEDILLEADLMFPVIKYPITYNYVNSTVSGPSEAAVGDTVTVSAVPDVDYGITDPTTQITVTNNDDPVSFTWDASTNRITFVMPDPT